MSAPDRPIATLPEAAETRARLVADEAAYIRASAWCRCIRPVLCGVYISWHACRLCGRCTRRRVAPWRVARPKSVGVRDGDPGASSAHEDAQGGWDHFPLPASLNTAPNLRAHDRELKPG